MKLKQFIIPLILIICSQITVKAQTYKIDQLKEVPFIGNESMAIIASSIWTKYEEAIKNPQNNSSIKSASETIYGYYDINNDGKLHKVNPTNGSMYSMNDSLELKKNNRLLFNLIFDENGKLIIKDKICVISNRMSKGDYGEPIGLISFELNIPDSIKERFSKVSLKRLAKIDINSLAGELRPVATEIPFNLTEKTTEKVERIYGKVLVDIHNKADHFNFSFSEAWVSWEINGAPPISSSTQEEISSLLKDEIIEAVKSNSDVTKYKNGGFSFTIEKRTGYNSYDIDMNIFHDTMVWRSEVQKTSINTLKEIAKYKILKFEGTGKKL